MQGIQGLSARQAICGVTQRSTRCIPQVLKPADALVPTAAGCSGRVTSCAVAESTVAPPSNDSNHIPTHDLPAPRAAQLIRNSTAFIEEHRIRSYEADPDQRTNIVTIANLLQVLLSRDHAACKNRLLL